MLLTKNNMKTSTLFKTSIIGSIVFALCCFTPVLVLLFAAIGISAWVGYLDVVLLPALALFIALTIYAFIRQNKAST
ncbi:MAG: mercury resistance system transport protein MerF [Mariprofundaceae bacterium]|nr:mercury resistance system transport protein MerF [Mariprofundaceae bacterium]